jgi:catalase
MEAASTSPQARLELRAASRPEQDTIQAGTLYRDVMDTTDREHLVTNIVAHASDGVLQARVIGCWSSVDAELGARVASGLASGNGHGAALSDNAVRAER